MKKISSFLGYAALFLFLLSFSIAFIINFTPLYSFDISYLNIEKSTGLPKEALMENYQQLLRYLNFPWIKELSLPDFPSSESGLFHFYEVKRLFLLDYFIMLASGAASFLFIRRKKQARRLWEMIFPLRFLSILPISLLFLIAVNFNRLFILFHHLFFNNDAWLFDWRTDPVILALPERFFLHAFAGVFLLLQLGIGVCYFWVKRRVEQEKTRR